MIKRIVILLVMVSLLLTACTGIKNEKITYDFYEDKEVLELKPIEFSMEDSQDITERKMNQHFQQYYGWKHLIDHKLYWNGNDEVQMDFTFSKDSDLWELEAANNYIVDTFILGKINNNLIHEYQSWMLGKEFQKIFAQVYVDDQLITQEYFEKKGSDFEHTYYETGDILLDKQKFEPENKKELKKAVFEQLPKGDRKISYRMDLSQTCIIVSINTFSQVNPDKLMDLESALSTISEQKKDILLELYCEEKLYYQNFLSNLD